MCILRTVGKCRASVFLTSLSRTSLSKIYHLCSTAVYTHLPTVRRKHGNSAHLPKVRKVRQQEKHGYRALSKQAASAHLPKVRQGKCEMRGRGLTRLRNGTESRLSLPLWQVNRSAMPSRRHAEREQKKSMSQRLQIAGITAAEAQGRKSHVARGPQQRFCWKDASIHNSSKCSKCCRL